MKPDYTTAKDLIAQIEKEIEYLRDVRKHLDKVSIIYFQLFQNEIYAPLEARYKATFLDAFKTSEKVKEFEKSTRLTINELKKCL